MPSFSWAQDPTENPDPTDSGSIPLFSVVAGFTPVRVNQQRARVTREEPMKMKHTDIIN